MVRGSPLGGRKQGEEDLRGQEGQAGGQGQGQDRVVCWQVVEGVAKEEEHQAGQGLDEE